MTFKKTTKTDKSICVSSRIEWIRKHITTKESVYMFLNSLVVPNVKYMVGGRSPISLVTPIMYQHNGRASNTNIVNSRFMNSKITVEKYGIRFWFRTNWDAKMLGYVLSKVFKTSKIRMTDDPKHPFNIVVKLGEPSGVVEFDTTIEEQVSSYREEISVIESYVRYETKKIEENRKAIRRIEDIINSESRKVHTYHEQIHALNHKIHELIGY